MKMTFQYHLKFVFFMNIKSKKFVHESSKVNITSYGFSQLCKCEKFKELFHFTNCLFFLHELIEHDDLKALFQQSHHSEYHLVRAGATGAWAPVKIEQWVPGTRPQKIFQL